MRVALVGRREKRRLSNLSGTVSLHGRASARYSCRKAPVRGQNWRFRLGFNARVAVYGGCRDVDRSPRYQWRIISPCGKRRCLTLTRSVKIDFGADRVLR